MAETLVLRQSAIVRNASVGASPPHGPVKTGELQLVQVRSTPGGPQVKSQPAKAVEILPPRDAASAVRTGGLPMVNIKMTSQGPQIDDGQDNPVVIRDNRRGGVAAGGLPMVQVKMENGRAQVQTVPNVQDGPPRIQNAPTAVSQPRGIYRVATPATSAPRGGFRVAAPQLSPQAALPPMPELNADQLMLLRHAADKFLGELRASTETFAESESEESASKEVVNTEETVNAANIQIAVSAIETIDQMMVTVAVRAEAAAKAAAAAAAAPATFAPVARPSIVPAAPTASYVAGRVGGRPQTGVGRGVQRNASMAPRRVARGGSPLPPVIVKMDGGRSVVQNQEEVATARAEALAQRTVQVPAPEMVAPAEVVSAEVVSSEVADGAQG